MKLLNPVNTSFLPLPVPLSVFPPLLFLSTTFMVLELDSLDETNAMNLINQRLGMKQDYSRSISITAEAIKSIFALTNGNSRNIIRYARGNLKGHIV